MSSFVDRAVPRIGSLERRLRLRWPALAGANAFRPLGAIVFLMAVLIALPIPFGNVLPGAAVLMIALGLAQRDGAAVAVGLVVALLACVFSAGILAGGWRLVAGLTGSGAP